MKIMSEKFFAEREAYYNMQIQNHEQSLRKLIHELANTKSDEELYKYVSKYLQYCHEYGLDCNDDPESRMWYDEYHVQRQLRKGLPDLEICEFDDFLEDVPF